MDLYAFLHPKDTELTKEIVISDRFKDKDGNVVPFKIKALTQDENDTISNRCYKVKNNMRTFDMLEYNRRLIVAATVVPDFKNSELCAAYGVTDPTQAAAKMLYAGEFATLVNAISELSGFATMQERTAEEAKN